MASYNKDAFYRSGKKTISCILGGSIGERETKKGIVYVVRYKDDHDSWRQKPVGQSLDAAKQFLWLRL